MALLGTVCEPHIIHLMQGPLRAPSLVQAVVGYLGVEVEAGSLAAAEGSVSGSDCMDNMGTSVGRDHRPSWNWNSLLFKTVQNAGQR